MVYRLRYIGETLVLRDALYRRFARVLNFGDLQSDGTVQYSVNKIVHSDTATPESLTPMQLQEVESVKTFDLKKYINISSDQVRVNSFLSDLEDM